MHKFILLLLVAGNMFVAKAQYSGYTALNDLGKFKQQFAAAAQKVLSIKSDFVQEKSLSMLSEKIISKGKFWFKKDNRVRMEYSQPFQYLMIINKDKVLVKDGQKQNTISTKSNKLFQQINKITVDCVQGTVLDNTYFKTRVFENSSNYLVEMAPVAKGLKDFFKTITVTIDKKDYSVNTINMSENSGDNTTLSFKNKEMNTTIDDALFTIN